MSKFQRMSPEGFVPELTVAGTARECGRTLGMAWSHALRLEAEHKNPGIVWWKARSLQKTIERIAPHVPDLYAGMAHGAGVAEEKLGALLKNESGGCTSFAIHPRATLDGQPLSGQTKDTGDGRIYQYLVLRLKLTDAPPALTLTYPGWLFGHGFVVGGCAIFRNSLFAGLAKGLPYDAWGLLALHCRSVAQVVELTRKLGAEVGGHCAIADEHGGIVGIEFARAGINVVKPRNGILTHANHVTLGARARKAQQMPSERKSLECSLYRQARLRERLEADWGGLTPQLAVAALSDQTRYPFSICRSLGPHCVTSAAVVVEPTRRRMHVTRGMPSQNWPKTYEL